MVQNFTEMPPDPLEEVFFYIFAEKVHNTWATLLPVDCYAPHMNLAT